MSYVKSPPPSSGIMNRRPAEQRVRTDHVFGDFMASDEVIYETSVMLDDGAFRAFLSLQRDCFIVNAMRVGESVGIRRYSWPYAKIKRTLRVVCEKPTLILLMETESRRQCDDEDLIFTFAGYGERDSFAARFKSLAKLYGYRSDTCKPNEDIYRSRSGSLYKIQNNDCSDKLTVMIKSDSSKSGENELATRRETKRGGFDDTGYTTEQSVVSTPSIVEPKIIGIDDLLSPESLDRFARREASGNPAPPITEQHKFPLATTTTPRLDGDDNASSLLNVDLGQKIKSIDLNSTSGCENGKLILGSELIDVPIDLAAIGLDSEKYGNLGVSAKMKLNIILDLENLERVKLIHDKQDRLQAMRDLVTVEMDPCNLSSSQISVKGR